MIKNCQICQNKLKNDGIYVPSQIPQKFNGIVIVGECAGYYEAKTKQVFSGESGKLLDKVLKDVGIERNQCYITNVVKCYFEDKKVNKKEELEQCYQSLREELLNLKNIKVIVCLGNIASNFLLSVKNITKQSGEVNEVVFGNQKVFCISLVHPAYILRQNGEDYLLYEGFVKAKRLSQNAQIQPVQDFVVEDNPDIFVKELKKNIPIVLDVETTGFNPRLDKLMSISYCHLNNPKKIYFALWEDIRSKIDLNIPLKLVGHNLKFDIQFLWSKGFQNLIPIGDTMLLHFIMEQSSGNLKKIAWKFAPEFAGYDIYRITKDNLLEAEMVERQKLKMYNSYDVRVTAEIYHKLFPKLTQNQSVLYNDVYIPLIEAVAEMEYKGLRIDVPKLKQWITESQKKLLDLRAKYETMTGGANINSVVQLREVLKKFKLDKYIIKRTPKGEISTDEEVLNSLLGKHSIIELLLEYRKESKIYSTYLKGLLDKMEGDKIYPQYWIGRYYGEEGGGGTITGRLSSSNPNAQNIPVYIRELFIPDNDDEILVQLDYSQIEMRVAGLLSKDLRLAKYLNSQDFHRFVASKIFEKPQKDITDEERKLAKGVSFGVLYGMSVGTLADAYLEGDINKAQKLWKKYFNMFKKLAVWRKNQINKVAETHRITNIFGLSRYVSEEEDSSRIAINTPIQGVAGIICLWAIGNLYNYIKKNKLKSSIKATVHDSILISMPIYEVEKHLEKFKQLAENVYELLNKVWDWNKMDFYVDIEIGSNWAFKENNKDKEEVKQ